MIQVREHPRLVLNPFLIYIGSALLAGLLQAAIPLAFLPLPASKLTGAVIFLANLPFGLPALIRMIRAGTSPNPSRPSTTLILSGPYRFSRNPMYIGLTLVYLGLMTFFRLTWGVLFTPIVIWLTTTWVIRPEERYLESRFGNEYLEYKKKVHRWI